MWETFPIEFRGGLISNLSPMQHGINAVGSATTLQNFEVSKEGGYKKVLGYTKYIDDTVPGEGPILGVKVVDSEQAIVARSNGTNTQYYINSAGSWSSLVTASSLGNVVRGEKFNFDGDVKFIFVDGTNTPAIYNDTSGTMSYPSGYPSDVSGGEFVSIFKNAVFISKGPNLAFSAPYDEEDFSAASGGGVINVGDDITGLKSFRDQLIVFCRDSIKRLSGSSSADFQLTPITADIGCVEPDSIQEVGGDIIFLGPDGLRLLGATQRIGDFALGVVSDKIEKDFDDFMASSNRFSSVVIRGKAQYRIFAYNQSTNSKNSRGFAATKFSDQGAENIAFGELKGFKSYVCDSRYVDNQEIIIFGEDDGYIYLMESGNSFDGEIIQSIYQSPFMPINDPQFRKTLYKGTFYVDTNGALDLKLNIIYDLFQPDNFNQNVRPLTIDIVSSGGGSAVYGYAIYGSATYGSEPDKVFNTPLIGSGKTFSFKLEESTTNPSFSLDTAIFEYSMNDRI